MTVDLAAERACLGALLTGALASRDVEPDLFGHPHHARLARALMAWRGDDKRARALSTIPLHAPIPGMPHTAPPLPPAWAFVVADGAPVSLLTLARSAPKRWPALEAVRVLRDCADARAAERERAERDAYDLTRDRETLVAAAAEMVDGYLRGFLRTVREDGGVMFRAADVKREDGGGEYYEPRWYVRPIDAEAIPDPRALVREVAARLTVA